MMNMVWAANSNSGEVQNSRQHLLFPDMATEHYLLFCQWYRWLCRQMLLLPFLIRLTWLMWMMMTMAFVAEINDRKWNYCERNENENM